LLTVQTAMPRSAVAVAVDTPSIVVAVSITYMYTHMGKLSLLHTHHKVLAHMHAWHSQKAKSHVSPPYPAAHWHDVSFTHSPPLEQ